MKAHEAEEVLEERRPRRVVVFIVAAVAMSVSADSTAATHDEGIGGTAAAPLRRGCVAAVARHRRRVEVGASPRRRLGIRRRSGWFRYSSACSDGRSSEARRDPWGEATVAAPALVPLRRAASGGVARIGWLESEDDTDSGRGTLPPPLESPGRVGVPASLAEATTDPKGKPPTAAMLSRSS